VFKHEIQTYLAMQRLKQEVYKLLNIFHENAEIRYMLQVVQAIRRHAVNWTHMAMWPWMASWRDSSTRTSTDL